MTNEDLHEPAGAYALDALDADDRRAAAVAAAAAIAIGLWAGLSGGGSSPRIALSQTSSGTAPASVSGLDAAPAGKVYVLWVIAGAGSTPRPAGSLSGGGKTVIRLSRPVPKGATGAITLERSPGVTTPTLPILVQTTASV